MYSIPQQQSNNGLKLSLTAGGLTLGMGLAYLYYQNKKKSTNPELDISKETVIRILKEFRKEFYPVFKNLSLASLKIQNEYKSRYQVSADQMKEVLYMHLVEENPVFKPQILDIEDRVYSKYDVINRAEFERLCNELAKADLSIRQLMGEIKELFRMAILGILKPANIELPSNFSDDTVLEIYKDTVKQVLSTITDYIRKYIEEHGSIGMSDENFHVGIQNLNIDQIKSRIIKNAGLDINDDFHPQQIFTFALNKFSKENTSFNEKINKIETLNQEIMQKLFMPNADFEQIVRELSRFDQVIAPPEPIIQLADPSELYPPVEVQATEDQVVTVHVDDHVHLEKSINKSHHNKSLNKSRNEDEKHEEHHDTTNILDQLDTHHHEAPVTVVVEEDKVITIEIPAEDIPLNNDDETKVDEKPAEKHEESTPVEEHENA